MATDPAPPNTTPLKKKPLFKRRAIFKPSDADQAKPSASAATDEKGSSDDDLDLFRRSRQVFPQAVRDQEEHSRTQAARAKPGTPRKHKDIVAPDQKRRKVAAAGEDDDDIYGVSDRELQRRARVSSGGASETPTTPPLRRAANPGEASPSRPGSGLSVTAKGKQPAKPYTLTSPRSTLSTPVKAVNTASEIICISDDDDEPKSRAAAAIGAAPSPSPVKGAGVAIVRESHGVAASWPIDIEEDDPMEGVDDEYAEYITRAKTRDALAKLARDRSSTALRSAAASGPTAVRPHDPNNPVITVFVNSRLESTHPIPPMSAKIQFTQQLRVVRKSFVQRARTQNRLELSEAESEDIILTWCGNRLYDSTTPMSLAARPDGEGRYVSQRSGKLLSRETDGFEKGGLMFEAWQLRTYEAFLGEKEKKRQRALDSGADSEEEMFAGQADGAGATEDQAEARKIRLTLKPKTLAPLNMTAHPETKVAVLIHAFRTQRQLSPGTKVALYWDGERLDEEMSLADTEIEDEDTIEVHTA